MLLFSIQISILLSTLSSELSSPRPIGNDRSNPGILFAQVIGHVLGIERLHRTVEFDRETVALSELSLSIASSQAAVADAAPKNAAGTIPSGNPQDNPHVAGGPQPGFSFPQVEDPKSGPSPLFYPKPPLPVQGGSQNKDCVEDPSGTSTPKATILEVSPCCLFIGLLDCGYTGIPFPEYYLPMIQENGLI